MLPFSNDLGMDHFCGPMPRVADAAAAVDVMARKVIGRAPQIRTARPSCLMADAQDLGALLVWHPADPRSKLNVIDLPMRVGPGAVVAHDSTCTHRTLERPLGAEPPLLVAAMIVKDEEKMLPDCLASLEGLVDGIVIVDTGSSDRTVEIAEQAGARVIHRAWRDDFGWARTEALAATGDATWVITVDADDRLVCPDPVWIRGLLASYEDEYEAFEVIVANRPGSLEASMTTSFASPRIFRGGRFRYHGAVHEILMYRDRIDAPLASRLEGVEVVHVGYDARVIEERGKRERNLAIARDQWEHDPSPKHSIEYARSIRFAGGDPRQAYDLLASILDLVPAHERRTLAHVHSLMAENMLAAGDPERALEHGRVAVELVPADDIAAQTLARAALVLARPEEVVQMEERRESAISITPLFSSQPARRSARTMGSIARAMLGRPDEAREVAEEILREDPTAFGGWEPLVAAHVELPPERAVGELVGLALLDDTGAAFAAVAQRFPPAFTAGFCERYVELGGARPEAVRVGLLAALVAGLDGTFEKLAAHADRLDDPLAEAIAERAELRGRPDLAAAVRRELAVKTDRSG